MVESRSDNLDLIFHALSDPTRRAILRKISHKEKVVTEIAEPFGMSLAAVSKHIVVLERAKLVNRRKEGSYYYLSLNSSTLMSADEWMSYYRKFWEGQLKSLKKYLEKEKK